MSSKFSQPQRRNDGATSNPHRRAMAIDPMTGIGYLSNLVPDNRTQGRPLSSTYLQQAGMMNGGANSAYSAPPLPPRPNSTQYNRYGYSGYGGMNRYGGMNSLYSPYGPSRYSSGLYSNSMYSPYSSYRMPYGPHGAPSDGYNSFLQMAEESTRPAFESIESVVHVVNSISMMLESTYGAVYSSYSAILGVVDQFSRLKEHFTQIFSVLAMLKGLHWLCLKVLYLLGLRKSNPSVEEAWQTARKAAATGDFPPNATKSSAWPFFMFLSLVVGAPWLMFKLLSRNAVKAPFDPKVWTSSTGKTYEVNGAYDFVATQPGELSFRTGEKLTLLPQHVEVPPSARKSWVLACNEKKETGLIPVNYITNSRDPRSNLPNNIPSQRISAVQQRHPELRHALERNNTFTNTTNAVFNTGIAKCDEDLEDVPNLNTTKKDFNTGVTNRDTDLIDAPIPLLSDTDQNLSGLHSDLVTTDQKSKASSESHLADKVPDCIPISESSKKNLVNSEEAVSAADLAKDKGSLDAENPDVLPGSD